MPRLLTLESRNTPSKCIPAFCITRPDFLFLTSCVAMIRLRSFSFSKRMWFWAWSERSRFDMITEDKWEWNDDILWHFETESLEDAKWNKVWTWFKNLWKSAYNLASDLTNMVMNPIDTVNNLSKAAVWGLWIYLALMTI